jgi:hypothetical protein
MYEVHYWWHYSGIVKKTNIFGMDMPLPWIEITKEMYEDFLSE